MSTEVIPAVQVHEVITGVTLGGDPPDVDGTDETLYRGRIQEWLGASQGGEFSAPDGIGMRVSQVFWNLDCATDPDVSIYLVDDGGIKYLINTESALSGSYIQTNGGILVPPSFKLRVKANVAIDSATSVASEDTGVTGDGTTSDYSVQLANRPVTTSSVSLVAGSVTFTDNGAGVLTGAGGGGGTGTINYVTGAVEITVTTPSDFNGTNVIATYDYDSVGRVMVYTAQEWGTLTTSLFGQIGTQVLPPAMQRS